MRQHGQELLRQLRGLRLHFGNPSGGPGMVSPMHRFQPAQRQVGIHLRGRDIGVPQQGLHGPQIGSVLHHMGGATVAQHVRAGAGIQLLHQAPHPLPGKSGAAHGEKKPALPGRIASAGPAPGQIRVQSLDRHPPQGHNALLVPFTAHQHASLRQG